MSNKLMTCRGCKNTVEGNFCANCGQRVKVKRINSHYVLHEVQHLLHFEKGFLYTIKELITTPGQTVREFLTDDRSRLVKPLLFLILTSLIYTMINSFFQIEKGYVDFKIMEKSAMSSIFAWIQNHYGYANIMMGAFISLWVKLFFKKYDYNFFEILILLCFIMGMGMLIIAVFALIQGITKSDLMQVSGMITMAYCIWAVGQFYDQKKVATYIKAFISYLFGMITFFGLAILLGVLIDSLKN